MAESPDYPGLIDGLNGLIDTIDAGDHGLPALYRLLELGQHAAGAAGMSFAEYSGDRGRIIAAIGASEWALGRRVDPTDPRIAELLAGNRDAECPVDVLPTELAAHLRGRGLLRMIAARAELEGQLIGSLHAFYPDGELGRPVAAEHRALVRWLATTAAHFYAERYLRLAQSDAAARPADGLAILGVDGTVRLWNLAAERMTGWEAGRMVGTTLPIPVPPPGRSMDHRLTCGRWLQIACASLPGSDARVVSFRDVSEPLRRERDRDMFLAITSHELRTPVTVIKGYADTLTGHWDSLDEPTRREAARVLGQRAAELAQLLDRLLSAASHTGGVVGGAALVAFDLVDALRAAADRLPADLRRSLRLDLPAALPKAHGDRTSVPTVLTELVTNAYKYSPDGPDVSISADADGQTVFFRVADRGIGVPPEHVERAFERFWQGEAEELPQYGGVGLGLYLVRRIVERQNGWVSLRPRERGGTVAEVRLPRADVASGEAYGVDGGR